MSHLTRLLLALLVLCFALAACDSPTTTILPQPPDAGTVTDGGGLQIESVTVKVSPDVFCLGGCLSFYAGDNRPFVAEVKDVEGNVYTDYAVRWSTGDEAIATVDESGLATGVSEGTTTVRATAGGKTGEVEINILPPRIASIVVTPGTGSIASGATIQLTATVKGDQNQIIDGVQVDWMTNDPRVATVNGDGVVTGVGRGVAIVSASAGNAAGWASITVTTGDPIPAGLALSALDTGDTHSCGLTADGTAFCWGWNYFGQLGNNERGGAQERFPTPMEVVTDMKFSRLRLGMYHSCGILTDGKAACWGSNGSGELGTHDTIGTVGGTTVPYPVLGDHTFVELAAGGSHTCGLKENGDAYCWGLNWDGQLGKGDLVNAPTPTLTRQVTPFKAITTGLQSTCALDNDGVAYCWGRNSMGQIGSGELGDSHIVREPTEVSGNLKFTHIHMASAHVCAVSTGGDVYCWGRNDFGQIGSGTSSQRVNAPEKVNASEKFFMVTTGAHHSCGLALSGRVYCWGNNDNAQLGDGTLTSRTAPVQVLTDLLFESIESGANATCGLTTDGEAYCWGSGYYGETGSGRGGDGVSSVIPWPVTQPLE